MGWYEFFWQTGQSVAWPLGLSEGVQVSHGYIGFAGGLPVAESLGPGAPGYVVLDGVEGDHGSVWPCDGFLLPRQS